MNNTATNPILDSNNIVEGTTCFHEHDKLNISCKKASCKYWIDSKDSNNCSMIAARHGPMTLQEIGDIFGVTRMRVCQIEKAVIQKLAVKTGKISDL